MIWCLKIFNNKRLDNKLFKFKKIYAKKLKMKIYGFMMMDYNKYNSQYKNYCPVNMLSDKFRKKLFLILNKIKYNIHLNQILISIISFKIKIIRFKTKIKMINN